MTNPISSTWLHECLTRIRGARVGVIGDFGLEAHWWSDHGTGCQRVSRQWYVPGGAGRIAMNLASLGCNAVHTVGLIGDDMFGRHLVELMQSAGVRTDGMMKIQKDWQTEAVALTQPAELAMAEFGAFNVATELTLDRLAEAASRMAAWCELIVVYQHSPEGVCTAAMIHRINEVILRNTRCRFLADAKHRVLQFKNAMLRLDVAGAVEACGLDTHAATADESEAARAAAAKLFQGVRQTVFVSQGARGVLVADANGLHENPLPLELSAAQSPSTNLVVTSVLASVLAGGGDAVSASRLANMAIRRLQGRGDPLTPLTADELRQAYTKPAQP